MATIFGVVLLSVVLGALPDRPPRPPNPFAPSLPQLTDDEEERLDALVDCFILQDIGKLHGEEAKRAVAEFRALGPEAVFALIRGLNRAAEIEGSCPAVLIAKKLGSILRASGDPELLQFARENIGAGVRHTRHLAVIKDLRMLCTSRKAELARTGTTMRAAPAPVATRTRTTEELIQAAGAERGSRLRQILTELATRNGYQVITALGMAAETYDKETQQFARGLLGRALARRNPEVIRESLRDERAEIRAAAARVVGEKKLRMGKELIGLLADEDADVRNAAHEALVKLSGGTDFGPGPDADDASRAAAVKDWRKWWSARERR